MTSANVTPRRDFWDNPWTWACAFATAAIFGLWISEAKFGPRQSQIERQYQARQLHGQSIKPPGESKELSTPEETLITLKPLYVIVGVGLVASWLALLWTHFRAAEPEAAELKPKEDALLSRSESGR